MKILLVGGSGHVGQLITPYLKARHSLRVLDMSPPADPDIEFIQGSVLDPDTIRRAIEGVDAFVWLAMRNGQGGMVTDQDVESILNNYDLNTKALHLFCYLAQEAGVKRGVYTSSMSVHYRDRPFYPVGCVSRCDPTYTRGPPAPRSAPPRYCRRPKTSSAGNPGRWRRHASGYRRSQTP